MVQEVKAALYARVSTKEQIEGYSLDAQRRAFRTLVEGRGWIASHEYVEEGRSAHNDDVQRRPEFRQAIQDALEGKYDVLVVHKIDRFARRRRITDEYFDKLSKAGVGFVSVQEQMDFSTPTGTFALGMLGSLAQLYSDNLGQEVRKGLAERKAQGLYCGPLPFGAVKGEDGVPVPDPDTIGGVSLAFELAAQGKTDAEVARALNSAGYRTAGPRGGRPFANHGVRGLLTNRFYLGYLPDGDGGWVRAKHEPFITEDLWNQAQEARRRNRTSTHASSPHGKRKWSLTGLTFCWHCKGRIHTQYVYKGEPRLGCYRRQNGWDCRQKSANLSVYEVQIQAYLHSFHIPEDYQERILEYHREREATYRDAERERTVLESRLKRVKEMYEWGDYTKTEYETRRDDIVRELEALAPKLKATDHLDTLAQFLADIPAAWGAATQEQRNNLARALFDEVWLNDKAVAGVKPRPELDPFFRLNYEEFVKENIERSGSTRVELYLKHGTPVLLAA